MTKADGKLMRNLVRKLGHDEGLREFYERKNPKPLAKEPKLKAKEPLKPPKEA